MLISILKKRKERKNGRKENDATPYNWSGKASLVRGYLSGDFTEYGKSSTLQRKVIPSYKQ